MTRCAVLVLAVGCGSSSSTHDAAPGDPVASVDRARLQDDLAAISRSRPPGSPHWQTTQDLCATRLQTLGFTVERHRYATGVNVIGVRMGVGAPNERVVVSAHYDSVDRCAGADDNGTGVAATLEAARVLSFVPHVRTLVVACWDEEERGLLGSRAYVVREHVAGGSFAASFVFETIGYRSTAPNSQRTDAGLDMTFPAQAQAIAANEYRGDFILMIADSASAANLAAFEQQAAGLALPVIALPVPDAIKLAPSAAGLRRSDHAPFWEFDFPAIQITDTADFRNPHYHCSGGEDALADVDADFVTLVVKATVGAAVRALD